MTLNGISFRRNSKKRKKKNKGSKRMTSSRRRYLFFSQQVNMDRFKVCYYIFDCTNSFKVPIVNCPKY